MDGVSDGRVATHPPILVARQERLPEVWMAGWLMVTAWSEVVYWQPQANGIPGPAGRPQMVRWAHQQTGPREILVSEELYPRAERGSGSLVSKDELQRLEGLGER